MSCKKVFQMAGIMVALCFCFLQTARADGLITVREGPTVQGSTRSQDCANSWNASALQASSYTVAPYQNFNLYWCDPSYSSGGMTCSVEYFEIWVDAGAGYYLLYGGISPSVFQFTLAFTGTGTAQFFVRAYGGCVALRGVRAWPFDGLDSNVITIVCSTSSLSCASNPNPSSGAMGVSTSPTLSWPSVSGATSYDVYFGAGSSPPYVTNITGTSYSPGTLNQNTTYYWGVAPRNSGGSAGGCPVWSFMTTRMFRERDDPVSQRQPIQGHGDVEGLYQQHRLRHGGALSNLRFRSVLVLHFDQLGNDGRGPEWMRL